MLDHVWIWPVIILGIGFLIFIHEFGHFIMAKRHGVRVDVFSIGFGPSIWKKKVGATEYRVAWIPLGGYVKLAGELPTGDRIPEPDELWGKRPFARLQIFAAGAVMNLLIAFPICVLANLVGKLEHAPVVGNMSMPESYAGMLPGDVIVEVGGNPIRTMEQYRIEVVRRTKGGTVPVKVRRGAEEVTLNVMVMDSGMHQPMPAYNKVTAVDPQGLAAQKGIENGSLLQEIRWKTPEGEERRHLIQASGDLERALGQIKGNPFTMVVRTRGESRQADLQLPLQVTHEFPVDLRLIEPIVEDAAEGTPAYGVIKRGDRIKSVDGKSIRSWHDMKESLRGKANENIKVTVVRDGADTVLDVRPIRDPRGDGLLGLTHASSNTVADVAQESYYWKAGLRPGDRIRRVGDKTFNVYVFDLFGSDKVAANEPKFVERENDSPITLTATKMEHADDSQLGFELEPDSVFRTYAEWGLWARVKDGLYEPFSIVKLTYDIMIKLFSFQESAKGLAGPVGIFHVSYRTLQAGPGNFIWLLAIITVNLGIINLLPLPILDGGHMWILLLAEKIRGRPPSERFLMIFQYAGLAMFLFLFVFVTFNDVSRLFNARF